jgi:hypothetical protein
MALHYLVRIHGPFFFLSFSFLLHNFPFKKDQRLTPYEPLAMITGPPTPHTYMPSTGGPGQGYPTQHQFDTTGQVAPPGMKPRVTATLWEDEGSLCFQVEAKGVCVARREG